MTQLCDEEGLGEGTVLLDVCFWETITRGQCTPRALRNNAMYSVSMDLFLVIEGMISMSWRGESEGHERAAYFELGVEDVSRPSLWIWKTFSNGVTRNRNAGTLLSAAIASGNVEALRDIRSTTFLAMLDQTAFRSFGDVQNLRFLEIKNNHFGND